MRTNPIHSNNEHFDSTSELYLSFLQSVIDVFVLLKLLQLCLDQNLSDVHHLLHCQSQTLHRITELLLQERKKKQKHITSENHHLHS